jgi:histidinol phosphatase-like enzyme
MGFIDKDGTEVHDEGRPYLKSCVPGDIRWKPELLSVIQKHQTVLLKLVVKLI